MVRLVLVCLVLSVQEIPFKAKEDFEIKFDMSFKQRPAAGNYTIHLDETKEAHDRRTSYDLLPYLILKVKILTLLPAEIRIKAFRDGKDQVFNKKAIADMEFKLDLGFTDDVKDGISGYKHVIEFLSADKKTISQIVIEFDKEGNYMVNGEKRGKI
jgi:hypothetical protein